MPFHIDDELMLRLSMFFRFLLISSISSSISDLWARREKAYLVDRIVINEVIDQLQ